MGRVVKKTNAHVSEQRYQLSIPTPSSNGHSDTSVDEIMPYPTAFPAAALMPEPVVPSIVPDDVRLRAEALLDDAAANAEAMLNDAFARAQTLISDAAQRAETLVETERAQAQAQGYALGKETADREMDDMLVTMRNLVEMARAERHKIVENAEPELVRLAMGIAERVLHQQIALDRGVVVEMARTAIARLVDRESITVRVNPGDLERMRQHRDDMLAGGETKHVRIIEDQRVDRGGVVVETDGGSIDARISTQLNEAKRVLHIEDDVIVQPADTHETNLRAARAS